MALTCRSIKFLCRIARDIVGWAVSLGYVLMFTRELFIISVIPGGVLPISHTGSPYILFAEIALGIYSASFLLYMMLRWLSKLGKSKD
jgi:hypothetical protein